jgi:hypothetical protein
MHYAVNVDEATGAVTTKPQPVEVLSAQDLSEKVGGFDELLGEFGEALGNGFCELRNKKFSRLVVAPINLCSDHGQRVCRQLPTCKSGTDADPIVPVVGAVLPAGYEFRLAAVPADKVRLAQRVTFTDDPSLLQGLDATLVATPLPWPHTQSVSLPTGGVLAAGIQKGDVMVLGVIDGAGALGANAGTFRVVSITSDVAVVVEQQNGDAFIWTAGVCPFRFYPAATADSGGNNQLSDIPGSTVIVRNVGPDPLTTGTGATVRLDPTSPAPAGTATTWHPLSGAVLLVLDTISVATEQAPNAPNGAELAALYAAVLDALLDDAYPARDVNMIWPARKYSAIMTKLKQHVLEASSRGIGRVAFLAPDLLVAAIGDAVSDTAPGVGATRDERIEYSWPGVQTFVPEAVGYPITGSDGNVHTDGFLDGSGEGWLLSVCSNLPPERNPGQAADPVPAVLAPITGFQRGLSGVLGLPEYKLLRQKGIAALRNDRNVGFIFQSGITSSLESGRKNINRRRMADFIEDSIAGRLVSFCKLPLTDALKDAARGEVYAFLNQLLSPNNPPAQRIAAFEVDVKSGNTPDLEAQGIFVIIARVRTLATADFIVLQAEIGEGVKITTT